MTFGGHVTDISFNNARGAASTLQMSPPFAFSDVTMSVFPLRASLPTLENFCWNYLNPDPKLVQFRPFVPFVYLVILDYGRMSLEAANMGWVSQREVAFGIPLRWLNATDAGLEFHDWAFSSPFIFVDNELSMSTGREVYGWPKLLARLDPSVSEWVRNPHGARRVFQVSTKGTSEAYAGQTSEYHPLLSVFQHRTAGLLDMPPNLDAIVKPLSQMSDAMTGLTRLGADLAKTFVGMASDRITGSAVLPDMMDMNTLRSQLSKEKMEEWRSAGAWLPGIKDALWSLFPRLYANTINLKQFRDAANPHITCYQSITGARMPVKSFKQGGFLGPQNMLLGQLDGGFRIEINHLAGLPIVESLGLEVSEERVSGGTQVSTITPVAPLWMKVDMTYGLADTLIWRGRAGEWNEGDALRKAKAETAKQRDSTTAVGDFVKDLQSSNEDREAPPSTTTSAPPPQDAMLADFASDDDMDGINDLLSFDYIGAMNSFNTARGASEAVGGAFRIPDASVRVLPLKADPDAIQKFVREYLKVENHVRFEAWGDFVYLVINDNKQMNSEFSAISKRRAREMSLLVPVKCYQWFKDGDYPQSMDPKDAEADREIRVKRGTEKLLTTGFVNAFTYVDDVETAITANEVFGVPSMGSVIEASENEWLSRDPSRQRDQHEILRMNAQVLPELMAGARAVDRTLVDVSTHHPYHARIQETEEEALINWVTILAEDLQTKNNESMTDATDCGQGFALKLLGGAASFNQFSLKQFRDSSHTENACYQGLILRRHKLVKLSDIREIDAPVHVSITDYPTQPICQILGLKPKYSYPGPDRLVRVFESIRPFSFNGNITRGAGVTLFERVNSIEWKRVDRTEEALGWCKLADEDVSKYLHEMPDDTICEMAYQRHYPKSGRVLERHWTRADKKNLQSWYEKRFQSGEASNVMVKDRARPDGICVNIAPSWSDFDLPQGVNLAAWLSQNRDKERQYSQQEMAGYIESFSPATIADAVLSKRWGISNNAGLPKLQKFDFCIPVSSVPSRFANALFPERETQDGYWPHSVEFYKQRKSQEQMSFSAFKAELYTCLRSFALLYPDALYKDDHSSSDDWTMDRAIAALSETLGKYLDPEKSGAAKASANRAKRSIAHEGDLEGLVKATEAIVFQFFEAHIPEVFWLNSGASSQAYLRLFGGEQENISAPSLTDWKAAKSGIDTALGIIRQTFADKWEEYDEYEADQITYSFLGPSIRRIDENIRKIEAQGQVRGPMLVSETDVPEDDLEVGDLLRERLRLLINTGT